MRRLVVGVLLLALAGTAAGATYDTVLYTDEPTADLRMYGEVWPEYQAGSVEIILTYTLDLQNDAFNGTKITGFDVLVRNSTGTVLRHGVDISGLDIDSAPAEGYTEFNAPVPPEEVTDLEFRVNHSAVLRDGTTAERRLEGGIDPELRPPNRTLDSFRTNATEVHRDDLIWVEGNTTSIRELTVQNRTLDISVSRFAGQVPLPDGLAAGRQDVRFTISTSSDYIFRRNLTLDVLNRPPLLNITAPDRVPQGQDLEVGFETVDDAGITTYAATVGNETYTANTSAVVTSTAGMELGIHNITGYVEDTDGAVTRDWITVQVTSESNDGDGSGGDGEGSEDDGEEDEEDDTGSSRLPLIGPFRDFVTNLIRSLIG
jgi:hypothetical protein